MQNRTSRAKLKTTARWAGLGFVLLAIAFFIGFLVQNDARQVQASKKVPELEKVYREAVQLKLTATQLCKQTFPNQNCTTPDQLKSAAPLEFEYFTIKHKWYDDRAPEILNNLNARDRKYTPLPLSFDETATV